jgi:prevent-host-death family protein
MTMVMKEEMGAGEFKAKCLGLLDEVQKHRTEIVITKYGKAVAKLVPIEDSPGTVFGRMKGSVTFMGDIVSPVDDEWDANKDSDDPDDPAGHSLLDLDTSRRGK